MNLKQVALIGALIPFLALTTYVLATMGLSGFYAAAQANAATELMMLDLVIGLGILSVWMYSDARERSFSALPYLAITLVIGVAGPLLYLIRREAERSRTAPAGARKLAV